MKLYVSRSETVWIKSMNLHRCVFHVPRIKSGRNYIMTVPRFSSRQRFRHSRALSIILKLMGWARSVSLFSLFHSDGIREWQKVSILTVTEHPQQHFSFTINGIFALLFSYGGTRERERRSSSSVVNDKWWSKVMREWNRNRHWMREYNRHIFGIVCVEMWVIIEWWNEKAVKPQMRPATISNVWLKAKHLE